MYILGLHHPPHPHFISIPHKVASVVQTMSDSGNSSSVFDGYLAEVQQERDAGLREQEAYIHSITHGPVPQQIENIAGALNELRGQLDRMAQRHDSNHRELVTRSNDALSLLRQSMALIRESNHQGLGKFSTPSICHSLSGAK